MLKISELNNWQDGINKVIQGDCLDLMKKMPDKCTDLVVTDPPYGMEFRSNYRIVKHQKIANDNNLDWLPQLSKALYRVTKDDAHGYIFCSFHNIDLFKQIFVGGGWRVKNILVWHKNNTGMGDLEGNYAPQYELILFVTKGNKKLNGGRDSNILRFNRTGNELHPTQKPVDLMSYLIEKSTKKGDLVLDTFAGSCPVAIACHNLNRNFICIEKDYDYWKASVERLKNAQAQQKLF